MKIIANGKEYNVGEKELTIKGKGVVHDLMNMSQSEFMSLTFEERKKVVTTVATTVNMRYAQLKKAEAEFDRTPALIGWEKNVQNDTGKGGITTKGKTTNQELTAEYFKAKHYYNLPTGTVKKARAHVDKIRRIIENKKDDEEIRDWTAKTYKQFWDLYDKWADKSGNVTAHYKNVWQILLRESAKEEGGFSKFTNMTDEEFYEYFEKELKDTTVKTKLDEEQEKKEQKAKFMNEEEGDVDEFSTGTAFSKLQN